MAIRKENLISVLANANYPEENSVYPERNPSLGILEIEDKLIDKGNT